eukprot:gene14718-602_t
MRNYNLSKNMEEPKYERVLGAEIVRYGSEDAPRVAVQCGGQKINLQPAGWDYDCKARVHKAGTQDVCFVVNDLVPAIQRLRDNNIEIELGPVYRTGAKGEINSVYCRDSDGNLIELSEYI